MNEHNKDGTDEYQLFVVVDRRILIEAGSPFLSLCCCAIIMPSTLTTKLVNSKNILHIFSWKSFVWYYSSLFH